MAVFEGATTVLPGDVTAVLSAWSAGDRSAPNQLAPLVYGEMRRIAGGYLRKERAGHTLQRTELVHEAFARLMGGAIPECANRAHFLAMAAQQMRQVLIDHARQRRRLKRGGAATPLTGDVADERFAPPPVDILALDAALGRLASFDQRKSRVLEMHFFAGMTLEEIALVLGTHVNTVGRDLRLARAWLRVQLGERESAVRA